MSGVTVVCVFLTTVETKLCPPGVLRVMTQISRVVPLTMLLPGSNMDITSFGARSADVDVWKIDLIG